MSGSGSAAERPGTAVLYLAHKWSESIGQRFLRLRREVGAFADCFVLLQDDGGEVLRQWTTFMREHGAPDALAPFDADQLPTQLGHRYFGRGRVMGNTHFPLLAFARTRSYRHYWQLESDVEYRGNWLSFLGSYRHCETPLLSSHIHTFHEWPTWGWWRSLRLPPGVQVKVSALRKAFFPVFRISAGGIEAVEQAHGSGWLGHFEVLVPTALVRAGLAIEDLCLLNRCYVGPSQNPNPILNIQSTLRWRPEVSLNEFNHRGSGPLIFHPVKENWSFDGKGIVRWPESGTPVPPTAQANK